MSLDLWLHFLHVVSAMVWVGGGVILSLIAIRTRRSSDQRAMGEFARTLPYVGLRVLMPAVIILPVTGVWMVLADSEFSFSQLWVRLGLGLFALAFLVGAVYLSRVGIQLDREARRDSGGSSSLPRLLDRWLVGYGAVLVVLLVAVWDMVFKPVQ
jgi:uncharacterized membrane protein